MSPSEFDLRAALSDGEGDGLDVDRIVAAGQARRGQRRAHLLTAAAAVILVGGIGTGGAVLLGDRDRNSDQSQPAFSAPTNDAAGGRAAAPSLAESPSSSAASSAAARPDRAAADTAVACPTSFPQTLLPGGGSPGQFGSDGPLFAQPVVSIVVCGYGSGTTSATPARLVLAGDDATALAQSLENASKRAVARSCPPPEAIARLAIVGVTSAGRALRTVTTTLTEPACKVKVTNGTAVRYGWQPPASLEPTLIALTPASVPQASVQPSGKNIGTPIHN